MKVRLDFVTNSSSSSFIISLDPKELGLDVDGLRRVLELGASVFGTSDYEVITTKEEFDSYFLGIWAYRQDSTIEELLQDEDGLRERYDKAIASLSDGKIIIIEEIEQGDSIRANGLYNSQKKGLLEVLEGE